MPEIIHTSMQTFPNGWSTVLKKSPMRLNWQSPSPAPAQSGYPAMISAGSSESLPKRFKTYWRLWWRRGRSSPFRSARGSCTGRRGERIRPSLLHEKSGRRSIHTCMVGFAEWLFLVERSLVDPAVLDSYEHEFQRQLDSLIRRTRDPELRRTFEGMQRCPVRSRNGRLQPLRRLHPRGDHPQRLPPRVRCRRCPTADRIPDVVARGRER